VAIGEAAYAIIRALQTSLLLLLMWSRGWQVETIGDAYMVVSGAPTVSSAHAQNIANMALDMIASLEGFVAPAAGGNIHIRIGQSMLLLTRWLQFDYTSIRRIRRMYTVFRKKTDPVVNCP